MAKLTDKLAKLSKNSSNSSKPPSSDTVKPQREKKNNGSRNTGGQPGHTKHERIPFAKDEINDFLSHTLDAISDMFSIFHKEGQLTASGLAEAMEGSRKAFLDIAQGTRSQNGRAWCERIWSVLATCASQSRNAFDFIHQSIQAHFSDQPFSSLLGP